MYGYRRTKADLEDALNTMGVPERMKHSNGGPIPDYVCNYGSWIRKTLPNDFHLAWTQWRWMGRNSDLARIKNIVTAVQIEDTFPC